jgi:hypothetical protein
MFWLFLVGQSLYRDGEGHHSGKKRKNIRKHRHDRDWYKDHGHGGEIKRKGHHSRGCRKRNVNHCHGREIISKGHRSGGWRNGNQGNGRGGRGDDQGRGRQASLKITTREEDEM